MPGVGCVPAGLLTFVTDRSAMPAITVVDVDATSFPRLFPVMAPWVTVAVLVIVPPTWLELTFTTSVSA